MGIFDFLKKKEPEAKEPERKPARIPDPSEIVELDDARFYFAKAEDDTDERYVLDINLPENTVKVDVPQDDDGLFIKRIYLREEEGKIIGLQGDDVIFEVGKRSKAYKEMLPFARHSCSVALRIRESAYGKYYWARMKFLIVTVDEEGKPKLK